MSAAVILMKQRRLCRRFFEAGALTPQTARSMDELGIRPHWIFRRLVQKGVFVAASQDRWYLNAVALGHFEARQRRILWGMAVVGLAALALLVLLR